MNDLRDFFFEFLAPIFLVAMVLAACAFGVIAIWTATGERWSCEALPKQYGIETSFTFWGGCAVKTEQGWIPRSAWEQRDIRNRHEITVK